MYNRQFLFRGWGGSKQEKNFSKRSTCTFSDKTEVYTELQSKFTGNKEKPIPVKAILSPPKKRFNPETPHNQLRNDGVP